jgi:ABC-type uncharacterized transport system fused permease/ATPase subunit
MLLGAETAMFLERVMSKIKIVGVITYATGLTRDLLDPSRLARDPTDYVKRLLGIVWPSFAENVPVDRSEGKVQLTTLVVVSLLRTVLMNRMANLTQRFNQFIHTSHRKTGVTSLVSEAAVFIVAGAALTALRQHATTSLAVVFRSRLTSAVHSKYFKHSAYYHISNLPGRKAIPDADQRVSSEVASVATRLTNLVALLVKAVPPLLWFTYRLWAARGWRVAIVPHLYLLLAYEGAQVRGPFIVTTITTNTICPYLC